MAKIDSPLGRYNVAQSQGQKRYVVDDATQQNVPQEYMHHFTSTNTNFDDEVDPRKMQEDVHRQKINERMYIPQQSKNILESLIGIGRSTKDEEIDGVVFSLRTLKTSEMRFIAANAHNRRGNDNPEDAFDLFTYTLAFSIYKINGQDFESILNSDKLEDKVNFTSSLDGSVCAYLYRKYEELTKQHIKKYNLDTPEGSREVVEDIKK